MLDILLLVASVDGRRRARLHGGWTRPPSPSLSDDDARLLI